MFWRRDSVNTHTHDRIPKIIHYCWFGGNPMPALVKRCFESWQYHLSDYEFVLWDETRFDVNSNLFVSQAYKAKKWAFVSDYVRLHALNEMGGIYLDSDVEVLQDLDAFLDHSAFMGFENERQLSTGIIGAVKGHNWISELLGYYDNRSFYRDNGKYDTTPNVKIVTEQARKYGLKDGDQYQMLEMDIHVYPTEYFSPLDPAGEHRPITSNTHAIHHFVASWVPWPKKMEAKIRRFIKKMIGKQRYYRIKSIFINSK